MNLTKRLIAVFLMLWLPLFSGGALAASVAMQMPAGHCQDESMSMADMANMEMDVAPMPGTNAPHTPACDSCGLCHLACTAYIAVSNVDIIFAQVSAREVAPYIVVFHSVTSAPLLPPPLALV